MECRGNAEYAAEPMLIWRSDALPGAVSLIPPDSTTDPTTVTLCNSKKSTEIKLKIRMTQLTASMAKNEIAQAKHDMSKIKSAHKLIQLLVKHLDGFMDLTEGISKV